MQVTVNGKSTQVQDGSTVAALLEELGLSKHPCAVEVNKKLVPKRLHTAHTLSNGDVLEIVTLVGGG